MSSKLKLVKTEKSCKLNEAGIYVFLTPKNMRKKEIRSVIEKQYSVKVDSVNIINLHKKERNFRGKTGYVMPQYKKAYIRLENGMKIETEVDVKGK